MKSIEINNEEKIILIQILSVSAEGMFVQEIRNSIKIIDKIESFVDTLSLEDSEHKYLLERINSTKFAKADKKLLSLIDKIESLNK